MSVLLRPGTGPSVRESSSIPCRSAQPNGKYFSDKYQQTGHHSDTWRGPQQSSLLGTLRSDDGDGNENLKKATGLISKTTTLHVHHASLCIFLPSLYDYDVKIPTFMLYRGCKQATTKFSFSVLLWIRLLAIQLQEGSHTFDKVSELE